MRPGEWVLVAPKDVLKGIHNPRRRQLFASTRTHPPAASRACALLATLSGGILQQARDAGHHSFRAHHSLAKAGTELKLRMASVACIPLPTITSSSAPPTYAARAGP